MPWFIFDEPFLVLQSQRYLLFIECNYMPSTVDLPRRLHYALRRATTAQLKCEYIYIPSTFYVILSLSFN
jgi:hypothetical protein